MKRVPFLLLPSLALFVAGAPAHAAPPGAELIDRSAGVLRIEAPRAQGGFALGSAVAVAPDKVVTNCHVTRDARAVAVVRGSVRWEAVSQSADVARDLCLLHVPGLAATPVTLGRAAALHAGEPVTALGFTGGFGMQRSEGEVIALHRHDGGHVIQSSNWFTSGASGGGLFDAQGRLVGILSFRLRGGNAHYFAAPVEWVAQMLAESERGNFRRIRPLSTAQRPYWQQSPAAQPAFLRAAAAPPSPRITDSPLP